MPITACDFIAGCVGGASGILVAHPLDTIKTWQQATNSTIKQSIYDIVIKNNGLNGFYRGMMFPLFTTGAINSLLFGIYGNQLRVFQNQCKDDAEKKRLWQRHVFLAGSVAGFVQSFLACPSELVKIRLQTRNRNRFLNFDNKFVNYIRRVIDYLDFRKGEKRGPLKCAKQIVQAHGVFGLYRGLLLTICRDVFPYGIYMLAYEQILNISRKFTIVDETKGTTVVNSRTEMMLTIVSGSLAGIFSWVVVIPFDVMKTIMQAETDMTKYRNTFHCIEFNVKKYGWKILFRGSWMLVVRAIPINAATFVGYEYALEQCHLLTKANKL